MKNLNLKIGDKVRLKPQLKFHPALAGKHHPSHVKTREKLEAEWRKVNPVLTVASIRPGAITVQEPCGKLWETYEFLLELP